MYGVFCPLTATCSADFETDKGLTFFFSLLVLPSVEMPRLRHQKDSIWASREEGVQGPPTRTDLNSEEVCII